VSELRDVAAALKSIGDSLTSIETCLAEGVVNGVQIRESLHDLRNKLHAELVERDRVDRSVTQIETWLGDYGKKLAVLMDKVGLWESRFEQLADEVTQGFRRDRAEIRRLKGQDEVTRT
jgi:hypothetical protein